MGKRNTTLKDIAMEAGISTTAVSKVLNDHGGVSKGTEQRVREIARRLNYSPNIVAKSLKVNNTKTIGLVVSDSSHSFFGSVIKGAEGKAQLLGYNIILANTNRNRGTEKQAISMLIGKRIDGLLLASSMLTKASDIEYLDSLNTPYVFLIRRSEDKNASFVGNDNVEGAQRIVEYLIKTGSKQIHFLNMDRESTSSVDRLEGYIRALEKNGLQYDPSLVYYAKPDIQEGYSVIRNILASEKPIEALFCGCDILGIGAMEAIFEKGMNIPEDIRICGYDDIEFTAYLRRPLTTMRQPKQIIGVRGIEILVAALKEKKDYQSIAVLKSELIVRQSA